VATSEGGEDTPMLTVKRPPRSTRCHECKVGAELPARIISNMVVFIVAGTIVAGVGMAMALDHWWPWVASAVASFILVKTA
jgi:hypothetical protein